MNAHVLARLAPAAVLVLAGTAVACGAPASGGSASSPDDSVSVDVPGASTPDRRPGKVRPRSGLTDLRRAAIRGHRVTSGGRGLVVSFWNGVPPCYRLGRVDVAYRPRTVRVAVWVGTDPAVAGRICPEMAVLQAARVTLDEPLDGRRVVHGGP
jgi:hypothetical protein